jgi:integrase
MAKGIYKRGKIYWIRYAGCDGRTVFESSGSTKFDVAQALYISRKKAIGDGDQPEIKNIANYSFKELSEKYLLWITGRQKSAKVKSYIIGQLVQTFGSLPLKRFNTLIVEQLQTDLINRGLKNSSCNKVMNVLKHMFAKAAEWEMVESETLKRIRKVKLLSDDSKRLRYLSKDEYQALVSACDVQQTCVVTALNTGMRRGDVKAQMENVDLRRLYLVGQMTKNGERREILSMTLSEAFAGTAKVGCSLSFFDKTTGKAFQDVKRSFGTALKKVEILKCPDCNFQKARVKSKEEAGHCPVCGVKVAVINGIQDFHFHDLRHTFASHLIMAGVDITIVKELSAHKDIKMTIRYFPPCAFPQGQSSRYSWIIR